MRTKLAFALLLACLSCESDADRAARRAEALLERGGERYRRLCQTRLSDGYAITYRHLKKPNLEYFDQSPWPLVVVPDSGALWSADESFTTEAANGSEPEPPSPGQIPPLDSADAVRLAQAKAGPTMRVHCYIPLHAAGGAWVWMVSRASSAKGPTLGGVVIAVGDNGRTNAVLTF